MNYEVDTMPARTKITLTKSLTGWNQKDATKNCAFN